MTRGLWALAVAWLMSAIGQAGGIVTESYPDLVKPAMAPVVLVVPDEEQPSGAPGDFTYQFATDGQAYALTSSVWQADVWGIRNIDAVWFVGYQRDGSIPVVGGGLEYNTSWRLVRDVDFVAKTSLAVVYRQTDAIEKGRLVFTVGAGIRWWVGGG